MSPWVKINHTPDASETCAVADNSEMRLFIKTYMSAVVLCSSQSQALNRANHMTFSENVPVLHHDTPYVFRD